MNVKQVSEVMGVVLSSITLASFIWGTVAKLRKRKLDLSQRPAFSICKNIVSSVSFKFPFLLIVVVTGGLVVWVLILNGVLSDYLKTANALDSTRGAAINVVLYEFNDVADMPSEGEFNDITKAFYHNLMVKSYDMDPPLSVRFFPIVDVSRNDSVPMEEKVATTEKIGRGGWAPFFFVWGEKIAFDRERVLYLNYEYMGPGYIDTHIAEPEKVRGVPRVSYAEHARKFRTKGNDDDLGRLAAENFFADLVVLRAWMFAAGNKKDERMYKICECAIPRLAGPEDRAIVLAQKGWLYELAGRAREAKREYERAVMLSKETGCEVSRDVVFRLGVLYEKIGAPPKRSDWLERGLDGTSYDAVNYYYLAKCSRGLGDLTAAMDYCNRAIYYERTYFDALSLRAELAEEMGDCESAVRDLNRCNLIKGGDADIVLRLARVYAETGRNDKAKECIAMARSMGLEPEEIKGVPELAALMK